MHPQYKKDILGVEGDVPLIKVSDYVKRKLDQIKREEQHSTYDSVLRALIFIYELQKKKGEVGEDATAEQN